MIFGQSFSEMLTWKKWFAWHPVETEDGKFVWLETVERRCPDNWASYYGTIPHIYRRLEKQAEAALREPVK